MRVLVTGGAGFIGSAVVDELVAQDHDVRVLDSLHPQAHDGKPDYLNDDAEYLFADLRDPEAVARAVRGIDAVSHQGAMVGLGADFADVDAYVGHNDLGTAVLLRALHDRRFSGRIVVASSMVVYGEGRYRCPADGVVRPGPRTRADLEAGRFEPRCATCGAVLCAEPVTEQAPTDPRNVYAATKLHQEHLAAAYGREHDSGIIALRYHNVYGPRMPRNTPYAGVAAIFRSAIDDGRPPQVLEDGQQRRDFIHVHDVARANLAALSSDVPHSGAFNVASGEPHSILDMARALCTSAPRSIEPRIVGGYRAGDVRHVFASPARAAAELGFRSRISFVRGMAEFARDPLRST